MFQNGAEHIYLMRGLSQWKHYEANQHLRSVNNNTKVLAFKSQVQFSVEEHFGCFGKDPSKIHKNKPGQSLYNLCSMPSPSIQAYPEVSLHFNNKETKGRHDSVAMCDPYAPAVALPSGTYVQFDPHRALYSKQMFWALPFYNGEKFEFTWSIIVQKLLQLNGNRLVLLSPGWKPMEKKLIQEAEIVYGIVKDFTCKDKGFTAL